MKDRYDRATSETTGGGFASLIERVWHRGLMRSGMVTGLLILLVVILLSFAYLERGRGHLHRLKERIASDQAVTSTTVLVGGQAPLTLSRSRTVTESMPEFLSATILPGRGMNVLQITAYIPGRGVVNLMSSPGVETAANAMSGRGDDSSGQASMYIGAAFEVPWADSIWGKSQASGEQIAAGWKGHTLLLPSATAGGGSAVGGLILKQQSDSSGTETLPDGGQAQATYSSAGYAGHWPSNTQVTTTVLLSSHSIDLTVQAHNVGDAAEPVGIGWHPRFSVMEGDRNQLRLRIPGLQRVETAKEQGGLPTGRLIPVSGTPYDFTARQGAKLGNTDLNDCFVSLHQDLLDSGPVAQFLDLNSGYGLRLTALSPTIRAVRVIAPRNGKFITIDPQFNFPDPFGKEWQSADTGMVVLQPGETTQWKVRLELISPNNDTPNF